MSAQDMILEARRIRQRLLFPANAVPDDGIDLKRVRIPIKTPPSPPTKNPETEVLEHPPMEAIMTDLTLIEQAKDLTINQILRAILHHYSVTITDLRSDTRRREHSMPRKIVYYLCYRYTGLSSTTVGKRLHRDHSTVLVGARKVKEQIMVDPELAGMINLIKAELFAGKYDRPDDIRRPAVAAKPESDLEILRQENLSESEICGVDSRGWHSYPPQEATSNPGSIWSYCDPFSTKQEADRPRQSSEGDSRSGTENRANPER